MLVAGFKKSSGQRAVLQVLAGIASTAAQYEVWFVHPRITATLDLLQLLPHLSWPIIFLSTFFASLDFVQRFRTRASEIQALEDTSLVAICQAVLAHDPRHIADWFGSLPAPCKQTRSGALDRDVHFDKDEGNGPWVVNSKG